MATIDWSQGTPRIIRNDLLKGTRWTADEAGNLSGAEGWYTPGGQDGNGESLGNNWITGDDLYRNANYKDLQAAGLWSNLGDLDNSPLWQQYFSNNPNGAAAKETFRNNPTAFNNTLLGIGGIDQYNTAHLTPDDIRAIQSAGLTPQQLQMLQGTVTARQQSGADKSFTEKADSAITTGLEIGVPAVLGTAFGGLAGVGPAAQGGTVGSASAGGTAAGGATSFVGPATGAIEAAPVIGASGAPAAAALGTSAAGLSSMLGPATGSVEAAPVIGASGAPTISGVASGSGPFVPVVGGQSGISNAVSNFIAPSSTGIGDVMTLAGIARGIPGILGAVASNNQADAYRDLSRDYMAVGAPARARFEASYAPGFSMEDDPGFKDAINQAAKATLHGLSVGGNPAGSPNAWAQSLSDLYQKSTYQALQNYRNQNASAGGMGALTSAAPSAAGNAVSQQGNVFNSIGAAANDIFSPRKSLSQLFQEIKAAGY